MAEETRSTVAKSKLKKPQVLMPVHPIPAGPEPAASIVPKDYVLKSPLKSPVLEAPSIIKEGFATRKPIN